MDIAFLRSFIYVDLHNTLTKSTDRDVQLSISLRFLGFPLPQFALEVGIAEELVTQLLFVVNGLEGCSCNALCFVDLVDDSLHSLSSADNQSPFGRTFSRSISCLQQWFRKPPHSQSS